MLVITMMMMMMPMSTVPTNKGPVGQEVGGLVLRFDSVTVSGAHLLGAIVLDEGVQGDHTVDFQQHRCGAQLLLARSAAKVAGRWTAAFLLTADLHA